MRIKIQARESNIHNMTVFLGLVTTTRITHATPAAAYGHSAHRDWECDSKIPEAELRKGCKDLGRQLIEDEPGKNINVRESLHY